MVGCAQCAADPVNAARPTHSRRTRRDGPSSGECEGFVLSVVEGLNWRREPTMPAEILKISPEAPDPQVLQYAAGFILSGQVVGLPTDTLYGLAADPFNLAAVQQIYSIKGRQEQKPLPILVSSIAQALLLIRDLPDNFSKLARRFWPGGLTLVVDASHRIPLKVTGNSGRVALRWPSSPVACGLIDAAKTPVTGTSANLAGFAGCGSAEQVLKQMGDRLPVILDAGDTGVTLASTIVDLRGDEWRVLREGPVTEAQVREALAE
jgi:tRNA threonylcarbamoyl adenosine modification protein (Sua5/YciO/YrdC/YwlC family)